MCVCLPVQHSFSRKAHRLENSINRELTFLISLIFHISEITIYSQMRNENVCSELTFQDRHSAWRFMLYFTLFFLLAPTRGSRKSPWLSKEDKSPWISGDRSGLAHQGKEEQNISTQQKKITNISTAGKRDFETWDGKLWSYIQ